ncbi:hypothetical protein RSOLAG22IIIB_04046 [Rhizoctonia solani]|uniref:Uncharacterized protein n=1 Tax=Rhizoctonia solani TaxID=456999 RepID=A0A0K6FU37_9AGAM|nr:hypothetical protein RSOLAG22IIIB_04046 [Rhizoctonia solani]
MVGNHLQRTGYRHGVLAIAALSALVAAMYTRSSFILPLSETMYHSLPVVGDAYIKPHRFATIIIVLNAITCVLATLMSLVLDWHFAIRIPAYVEFTWVGLAGCAELASVVLAGISAPHTDVCSLEKTSLGAYQRLVLAAKGLCSNWTAIFVTSVMALVMFAFHFTWHIIFRLWHRAALLRRPTSPIDLWNTPLPRYYPISPHEVEKMNETSLAPEERGTKPKNSNTVDPYNHILELFAVQNVERTKESAREHEVPVAKVSAPTEDQEVNSHYDFPPDLETEAKNQQMRSSDN